MESTKLHTGNVDIVNYLAILSLERIDILEPTEKEIREMEQILLMSIDNGLAYYSRKMKIFRKILNIVYSLFQKPKGKFLHN